MTQSDERPVAAAVELSRILAGRKHAPVVYFARMGDYVKIGTTTNLALRMRTFYLSLEDVLAVVPGSADVEAAYHKRFAESRHDDRRELFRINGQLARFLGSLRSAAAQASQDEPEVPAPAVPMSLSQACAKGILECSLDAARKASQRPGFPKPTGWDGPARLYSRADLAEWQDERTAAFR